MFVHECPHDPSRCKSTFQRTDGDNAFLLALQAHDQCCMSALVKCPYADSGCTAGAVGVLPRSELAPHLKSAREQHLRIALNRHLVTQSFARFASIEYSIPGWSRVPLNVFRYSEPHFFDGANLRMGVARRENGQLTMVLDRDRAGSCAFKFLVKCVSGSTFRSIEICRRSHMFGSTGGSAFMTFSLPEYCYDRQQDLVSLACLCRKNTTNWYDGQSHSIDS